MKHTSRSALRALAAAAFAAALFSAPEAGAVVTDSPTWGFTVDVPEGWEYTEGNGKDRFSFAEAGKGAVLAIAVYPAARWPAPAAALKDAAAKLKSKTDSADFAYRGRAASLSPLDFALPGGAMRGWALAMELASPAELAGAEVPEGEKRPIALLLAYGPKDAPGLQDKLVSALDAFSPTQGDLTCPGPLTVFAYPPEGEKKLGLSYKGKAFEAVVDKGAAEAAKSVVDREFRVLKGYIKSPLWKEAWKRFYRAVWRDSYERLGPVAFALERTIAAQDGEGPRPLAEGLLSWVQDFKYERDLMGTDFVDLVSAAAEGRGDCDSRALLAALLFQHANADAALMVSREYGHAMAAFDVPGAGARFKIGKKDYVVAETTAKVPLGRVAQDSADPAKWVGVDFPGLFAGR